MSSSAKPTILVYTDGSAKPNPGRGGYSYVVMVEGNSVEGRGVYLGDDDTAVTNNVAEWRALIAGLTRALEVRTVLERSDKRVWRGGVDIVVRPDSNLVVEQFNGRWACNEPGLRPLLEQARALVRPPHQRGVRVEHVLRERNQLANDLAQRAVDDAADVRLQCRIVPAPPPPPSSKRARSASE